MRRAPLAFLLALPLGACVADPLTVGDATARDACGASDFAGMMGMPLAALTVPQGARVIRPGDMVTQDFVPDRLNVVLDEADRLSRAFCG